MMSDCCDGFDMPIGAYTEPSKPSEHIKIKVQSGGVRLTTKWVNKEKYLVVYFHENQFEPFLIENPSIMSLDGSVILYRGIEFEYQNQQFKLI